MAKRLSDKLKEAEDVLDILLTFGCQDEKTLLTAYNAEVELRQRIELSAKSPETWLRRRAARVLSSQHHNGKVFVRGLLD